MIMLKRYRFWVLWAAAVAVLGWHLATDPSGGAETVVRLEWLLWALLAAAPAYLVRKGMHDYANGREVYRKAMESPTGAGLVFVGLCLLGGLLFLGIVARAGAADVPPAARALLPVLADEQGAHWPELSMPSVLAAQIEQETCITRTHRHCWSPRAELKTSREYGFGLGQHTRAFSADGGLRFDAHAEALEKYGPSLSAWTWDNRYDARLQLRAVVLGNRSCYGQIRRLGPDDYNTLAMCDAAHNGGLGGVLSERRICARVPGCDPDRWFGHVEHHSLKSRARTSGYGASWFEINRTHVRNVMIVRRPPYARWFGEEA